MKLAYLETKPSDIILISVLNVLENIGSLKDQSLKNLPLKTPVTHLFVFYKVFCMIANMDKHHR